MIRAEPGGRAATLRRLAAAELDVLVVGGGATGAAIARDAALRGMAVGLCEAGDFAGQTSSGSSKLIHGGLRYLQYGDLRLVFEGLGERRRLMTTAPHLCRPIEFVFPGYRGERPGLLALGAGIALYNGLALFRPPASARHLSARDVYAAAPLLRTAGLRGAETYVDCQTDDARLVLENVLDAESAGAAVCSRLMVRRVMRDRRGRAHGVEIADALSGAVLAARARVVVNATGPFSDSFDRGRRNLRPTLGVHLVFDAARLPHGGRALVLRTPQDNRLFFVLPAGARTIVGTTDTDWTAPERAGRDGNDGARPERGPRLGDEIRARGSDAAYLLEAVNHAFPAAQLATADVISTYAALRPLVAAPAHTPSATSREHEVLTEPDGVLTVAGGKLTTLRSMAEQAVDRVAEMLRDRGREGDIGPCVTATRPLPGGGPPPQALDEHELAPDVRRRLASAYGGRAGRVLGIAADAPELGRRIDPELPYLWAEVVHAARHEHALDVRDALVRRVPLLRDARDQGLAAAPRAAALMAEELGWTPLQRQRAVDDYAAAVALSRRWREDPGGAAAPPTRRDPRA